MRERPGSQLIERCRASVRQLLKHEHLGRTEPKSPLRRLPAQAQGLNDAAKRIHDPLDVGIIYMGPHILSRQ